MVTNKSESSDQLISAQGIRRRDELLRRALTTPPIISEVILKRSKESQSK